MGILTDYSLWLTPVCLLLGGIYAFFLYFRTNRESVGKWFFRSMTLLRFLTVSVIAFLLLSPVFRRDVTMIEKPVILVGIDNSASLLQGENAEDIPEWLETALLQVDQELNAFDLRLYSFGEKVVSPPDTGFRENRTDLSSFFSTISTQFLNRNVGAVVIITDGICNYGIDPLYAARDLSWPVYTVALGDTSIRKDLAISQVLVNKQVFLHDRFPVEIFSEAILSAGEQAELSVWQQGEVCFTKTISVSGPRFTDRTLVMLQAEKAGWQSFSVRITPLNGEVTHVNNQREMYVEVIEERSRIALVYDAPHPDIGALKNAMSGNRKYDFREYTTNTFLQEADTAELVVLYQVPSLQGIPLPVESLARFPSLLFILGSGSDLNAFDALKTGLHITASRQVFTDAYPQVNRNFSYFSLTGELIRDIAGFPPLLSPFGTYEASPLLEICCHQKILGLTTGYPLIAFVQDQDQKRGFICGENIWRWMLSDYLQNGDHLAFNELMQKIVQYLVVKRDRSQFRVTTLPEFFINEPVTFTAGLLNRSYEPVREAVISMEITDEAGTVFPFAFMPDGTSHYLNAGQFPPGIYRYKAVAEAGRDRFEKTGSFVIKPLQVEMMRLTADHHMLERLAVSHKGKLFYPDQIADLLSEVKNNDTVRSISYVRKQYTELIAFPWIFGLILLLLTTEWVIRKFTGLS